MEGKWDRQQQRQLVRVKGKQTLGFPELQLLSLTLLPFTRYKIYMTHQKGHKSLFDCGTLPEKYISRHLPPGQEAEGENWKHAQCKAVSHTCVCKHCVQEGTTQRSSHRQNTQASIYPASPGASVEQWDVAPPCHFQSLWSKCIRIDGAFHQMLLWGTWFVYLMKPVSQQICVLAVGNSGRCWWQISLKQGHWINKSN